MINCCPDNIEIVGLFIRFGQESVSDYKGDSILVPSQLDMEAFSGYSNAEDRHRVKRGGVYGGLGKKVSKIGKKFKKLCLIPGYGTVGCPLFKPIGKLYTKLGLGLKKAGKTLTKIAPILPVKGLKNAKTANPVTATKNVIKNAPKVVKTFKLLG